MENKVKQKFSRMFRSSLDSCRSKSRSDVSEQPFFFPENRFHHHQLIQLFSPKPLPARPLPPFRAPKSPQTTGPTSPLPPPTTTTTNTLFKHCKPRHKHRRRRSQSRKTRQKNNDKFDQFFTSVAANYYGCYSSDDEKEEENASKYDDDTTFFSSKSMSSDSSLAMEKSSTKQQWDNFDDDDDDELTAKIHADSFAVIKRSSDPYSDFRTSMVEMIVEKQIFGSKDLENLLHCFLSLNSLIHHRVIIEVFTEIWETLFSDWD
ncbi:hypothetical protein DCAR_0311889 [Daucus carota subsp. sativus]|uniref:Transcription repressor n=1 Tax=Daucus carota subsp. sativus TaxID=79200 RepID=A0A161XYA4_DAUCS|nr:PREDICTED: transcription repressor OFP8-like [Daucus carota subsp. sativus]WOG92616.1 hypothetical protein DCAR_0311889 [Daucus carota subsp. sativus]